MCVDQRAGVQKGSAAMIGLWTTLVVPRVKMCGCVVVMGESGAGLAEKMAVPTGSSCVVSRVRLRLREAGAERLVRAFSGSWERTTSVVSRVRLRLWEAGAARLVRALSGSWERTTCVVSGGRLRFRGAENGSANWE